MTCIKIDSFQDPKSDLYGKKSQIDSIQDPYILHPKWTHFKTLMFSHPNWLISRPRAVNYRKHHPIDSFQDPHIGLHSVLISMGNFLQIDSAKSPWETSFNHSHQNLNTVKFRLNFQTSRRWYITRNYLTHFKTPGQHVLHCTQWFLSKVTPFKTPTQNKDTATVHHTTMYIHISDSKLLKSILHPLRTYSRPPKSS